jgi:hypothetical protein
MIYNLTLQRNHESLKNMNNDLQPDTAKKP